MVIFGLSLWGNSGLSKKCMKHYVAEMADIYISPSNAGLLSGELATLLSGRYIEIKIHPLSYVEFAEFFELDYSKNPSELFLKQGGLPGLLHVHGGETAK
jgi:uncharacterized protein